jgi:hypothetical protein
MNFLLIPDPGSRGQKGTGSRIRIRNTGSYFSGINFTWKHFIYYGNYTQIKNEQEKLINLKRRKIFFIQLTRHLKF